MSQVTFDSRGGKFQSSEVLQVEVPFSRWTQVTESVLLLILGMQARNTWTFYPLWLLEQLVDQKARVTLVYECVGGVSTESSWFLSSVNGQVCACYIKTSHLSMCCGGWGWKIISLGPACLCIKALMLVIVLLLTEDEPSEGCPLSLCIYILLRGNMRWKFRGKAACGDSQFLTIYTQWI